MDDILQRFIERSPVAVMVQATLTRVLADTTLDQLVRVAGSRWAIEECFQTAKNETGLDHYQVRGYEPWYRHTSLSMLAAAFLVITRDAAKKGDPPPAPTNH